LVDMAMREYRSPADQIAYLMREGLQQAGYLLDADPPPKVPGDHDFPVRIITEVSYRCWERLLSLACDARRTPRAQARHILERVLLPEEGRADDVLDSPRQMERAIVDRFGIPTQVVGRQDTAIEGEQV
jgi:hypothetical protein